MVLESRHLIGVFLLMVVIFGVVFTLGYLLGRGQAGSARLLASNSPAATGPAASAAGTSSAKADPAATGGAPAPSDWDLYRPDPNKKASAPNAKPGKTAEAASKPPEPAPSSPKAPAGKGRAAMTAPLVPRGAILLQVAALTKESDALALAEALQQKKFPAFVLTPGADHFYRVQVGPYTDQKEANASLHKLENEGFKAIVKR
ncbi:MAG: SPOR domain-containing protein [Acidobacteria bacterium]|nr:SPOR domain-containing protein [Acidobacteriota bacterium]